LETITMPHFAPLALASALAAAPAFAPKALAQGGPYRVDDAAIAAPGTFKIEAYGSFSANRSRERGYTVIPNPIDQNRCAQSRRPMDMMRQG
jgi:hypothetical protein